MSCIGLHLQRDLQLGSFPYGGRDETETKTRVIGTRGVLQLGPVKINNLVAKISSDSAVRLVEVQCGPSTSRVCQKYNRRR
jgi:hypothetical protein